MRPPKRLWLPSMARNPWCRPACMSASLVLCWPTAPVHCIPHWQRLHTCKSPGLLTPGQGSCPPAANIHFCDITTPGIRLRAAVTGCLLLDINQGTFLQIWPVSSQLGLQRNDQIKININILPCYPSSNNINLQEMEEGTETFYSLKFKQCRMSAVNAEQASVKFYRKVWNAKIKEQVIQRVECGFLLVHFQWFSIFIMLKFSNEHDQMICRISNCTAHSKHRTSMFALELWEEVVSTLSNSKRHCTENRTCYRELGKPWNDEIASSRENECYKI